MEGRNGMEMKRNGMESTHPPKCNAGPRQMARPAWRQARQLRQQRITARARPLLRHSRSNDGGAAAPTYPRRDTVGAEAEATPPQLAQATATPARSAAERPATVRPLRPCASQRSRSFSAPLRRASSPPAARAASRHLTPAEEPTGRPDQQRRAVQQLSRFGRQQHLWRSWPAPRSARGSHRARRHAPPPSANSSTSA